MNSCYKVVRSIRNTTLKLKADSANCGKTYDGFWIRGQTLMLGRKVWPPYSPALASADFFLFPKTEDTDERKVFCYNGEDKRKIETEATGDTKKRVSEVFRCTYLIRYVS